MKNMLGIELGKAIKNWRFFFVVLAGCVLSIGSAVLNLQHYWEESAMLQLEAASGTITNQMVEVESFHNYWLVMDGYTFFFSLLFYVRPLLATIPFAWSYCQERNKAYERNMVVRCGRYRYYGAKYLTTFLSGGFAVLIPVLLNVLLIALFIPARTPQIDYLIYYGVNYGDMWSVIFYTMPGLYVLLRILLIFVSCGLLAVLGMSVAYITKNQVAVLVTPFFVCVALQVLGSALFAYNKTSAALSPIDFLGNGGNNAKPLWPALLEMGIIAAITIISTCVRGKRHEIY